MGAALQTVGAGFGVAFGVCLGVLWLLALGFAVVKISQKAIDGETSVPGAVLLGLPVILVVCGISACGGSAPRLIAVFLAGLLAPVYVGVLGLLSAMEDRRLAQRLNNEEVEKWGRSVAADERNAGAHLFLGNALLERGDHEGAVRCYRRALELDPTSAAELIERLDRARRPAAAYVRAHVPELNSAPGVAGQGRPTPTPLRGEEGGPREPVPEPSAAPQARPCALGYDSAEDRAEAEALQEDLRGLRLYLEGSPGDVHARLAYAGLLQQAGREDEAHIQRRRALEMQGCPPGAPVR